MLEARYYNGRDLNALNAEVTLGEENLKIILEDGSLFFWPYDKIIIIDKPDYGIPTKLSFKDEHEARLVVNDPNFYQVIYERIEKHHKPSLSIGISWNTFAILIIGVVFIFLGLHYGLPRISGHIAENMPRSWEENLGSYVVKAITSDIESCNNVEGQQALEKLVDELAKAIPNPGGYKFKVRVVNDEMVNAFAAPAGEIVVFRGLIDNADNEDEIAGVLAHEMGHVIYQHPTKGLVTGLGISMLTAIIFGSTGDFASTAAVLSQVYQLKYSREYEMEADKMAGEVLYNVNIGSQGLSTFFSKISELDVEIKPKKKKKKKNKDEDRAEYVKILDYMSTHPATDDRIEMIKQFKQPANPRKILNELEWKSLKRICILRK